MGLATVAWITFGSTIAMVALGVPREAMKFMLGSAFVLAAVAGLFS